MVKITVERRVAQSDVIDVEFPVFRQSWNVVGSSSYVCIYRMDSHGQVLSITKHESHGDGETAFEFERDAWDLNHAADFLEAKAGSYAEATADDWAKIMAEARAFIGAF